MLLNCFFFNILNSLKINLSFYYLWKSYKINMSNTFLNVFSQILSHDTKHLIHFVAKNNNKGIYNTCREIESEN